MIVIYEKEGEEGRREVVPLRRYWRGLGGWVLLLVVHNGINNCYKKKNKPLIKNNTNNNKKE